MTDIKYDLQPERIHTCRISRRGFLKLITAAGFAVIGCGGCQSVNSPVGTTTPQGKYDFRQISFCGIDCKAACPEYAYPTTCDGCKLLGGKCAPYCCKCTVRECASDKGVLTCAHCEEFPACDKETWKTYPSLRKQIDRLRAELQEQP